MKKLFLLTITLLSNSLYAMQPLPWLYAIQRAPAQVGNTPMAIQRAPAQVGNTPMAIEGVQQTITQKPFIFHICPPSLTIGALCTLTPEEIIAEDAAQLKQAEAVKADQKLAKQGEELKQKIADKKRARSSLQEQIKIAQKQKLTKQEQHLTNQEKTLKQEISDLIQTQNTILAEKGTVEPWMIDVARKQLKPGEHTFKEQIDTALKLNNIQYLKQALVRKALSDKIIDLNTFTYILKQAIQNGRLEFVEFLLAHAENIPQNVLDDLLFDADDRPYNINKIQKNYKIIKALIARGVKDYHKDFFKVEFFNRWNEYPLHKAVVENNLDEVRKYIKEGIKIDSLAPLKNDLVRPLDLAVAYNYIAIAQELINNGANVNDFLPNSRKRPLHQAAESGAKDTALLLIENDADVNGKNNLGTTAFHLASRNGHTDVAKLLIDHGADANAKDTYGITPLYRTSEHGHTDIAKLLIDHGADVNAPGQESITPLHNASNSGHTNMAKLLIDHGAGVNAKDTYSYTPLHFASSGGYTDIAELLIDHSANVNAKDHNDKTPLHRAAEKGRTDMAKLLIDHGADKTIETIEGRTALDYAREEGHTTIVDLLEQSPQPNATSSSTPANQKTLSEQKKEK